MASEEYCNLLVQEKDLKRLEDLDPSQTDGYRITYRSKINASIKFVDENNQQISDRQQLTITMLEKYVPVSAKQKNKTELTNIRLQITSQIDLYLNLIYNCNHNNFEDIKKKNGLNLKFRDFPTALAKMFDGSRSNVRDPNQIELQLTGEAPCTLRLFQKTEYKTLELLTLGFFQSEPQKTNQSIIYRYNYHKAKLNLLQGSLDSIYSILQKKNPSLLVYVKKTVGLV